jgi:hypothetical protein
MSASGHLQVTPTAEISAAIRDTLAGEPQLGIPFRPLPQPLARPPVPVTIEAMRVAWLVPLEERLGCGLRTEVAAVPVPGTR